jgi:hypothetical protein
LFSITVGFLVLYAPTSRDFQIDQKEQKNQESPNIAGWRSLAATRPFNNCIEEPRYYERGLGGQMAYYKLFEDHVGLIKNHNYLELSFTRGKSCRPATGTES